MSTATTPVSLNYTLRQLRVLIRATRLGGFGRAGEDVGLTQSAVSRSIAELEDTLGVRLLDRTTRVVVPTQAGLQLVGALEQLLAQLDDTMQNTRRLGERRHGSVAVVSPPTISSRLMPAAVAECSNRYPSIRLRVRDIAQADGMELIRDGAVDFGVLIEPRLAAGSSEFIVETIATDPFFFVCRTDHRLAAQKRVSWQSLDGEALVLLDQASGSRPLIDSLLLRHGARTTVTQELGHAAGVFGMVEARVGSSVLPSFALPVPRASRLVALPLTPKEVRRVVLVRRSDRSLSPAAEAVWALLKALPGRPTVSSRP